MEYLVGLLLALAVVFFSALIGLDRERSFYATTLIVVASYYILFAVMGGSEHALIVEILAASVFCVFAALGFKGNLWLVAIALIGHGVFDFFRRGLIENPGVPRWWPGFCMAFDVIFGFCLVVRLLQFFKSKRGLELKDKWLVWQKKFGSNVRENSSCTRSSFHQDEIRMGDESVA